MVNEFELRKLKKEHPEFFEKLPPRLFKKLLAEETSQQISDICLENNIREDEKIEKIAYQAALVLLDSLPPEEFPEALEKELKLDPATAKRIHKQINQRLFLSVKDRLSEPTGQPQKPVLPTKVKEKDTYREFVE